ncbi:hypothetical protein CEE86_14770, partial [Lactobacillus crispatus]
MHVLPRQRVERRGIERFAADFELALPHALAPLRMAVAEALHLEFQDRVERDGRGMAVDVDEVDFGRLRQPGVRHIFDAVPGSRHAAVEAIDDAGDLGLAAVERRGDALADQRLALSAVEEDRVRDVVVPDQR